VRVRVRACVNEVEVAREIVVGQSGARSQLGAVAFAPFRTR
jgi:hypothetical protein